MFKYKILQVGNESEGQLCHNYATAWQQAVNLAKQFIDNNWEPYSLDWLDIKKPLNIILFAENADILQIVIARV